MGDLSKLPNIGKEVESQLNIIGIFTYDELKDFYNFHKYNL
jgi:DNA transformation protein